MFKNEEIENLSTTERIKYYTNLKEKCKNLQPEKQNKYIKNIATIFFPYIRSFSYELIGINNIPQNKTCLFVLNHCNAHDYYIIEEVFALLKREINVFIANDGLTFFANFLCKYANVTSINRYDKSSIENGIYNFSNKLINDIDGVIFGEGTWNLHPYKIMHQIKLGAARLGAITNCVIIPTILEYFEISEKCVKENEIYTKCLVVFGKSITISPTKNLITETNKIQQELENLRYNIWQKYKINQKKLSPEVYINHTYLKKFGFPGCEYDSEKELNFLYFPPNTLRENEYTLNEFGQFVPGITKKFQK